MEVCAIVIFRRGPDPREIEIVELAVEATIVGEAAGFCGCVESVGRGVPGWWWARHRAGAVTDEGDLVVPTTDGDVAWARRYGTFVEGGGISLDAKIDCVGARGSVSRYF